MEEKKQLDIFEGRRLRDEGIATAKDHADQTYESWSELCFDMFRNYLKKKGKGAIIMVEDFRVEAIESGLPEPPHNRAFGFLSLKAKRAGLIKHHGFESVKNPKGHCAPVNTWEVL